MKKQTKAAAAAGAGAILLLGGAGSLAYWNDSGSAPGGTIRSGQLSLSDCAGGGTWTDENNNEIINITNFRVVPGDSVSYNCATNINATGDNLTATLTANVGEVTGDTALRDALDPVVTATVNGEALPSVGGAVQIAPTTTTTQSIVVTVTMTFDPATQDLIAQNQSVNLAATTLTLEQNDNPAVTP